jgi:hypothetical protein
MSDERLPSSEPTPSSEPPPGGLPGDVPQGLPSQQLALYRALSGVGESLVGERLGACYLGALAALAEPRNPDRRAQAAHSIREMMDMLPEAVDVRLEALREKLGNEAAKLEKAWQGAQKSGSLQEGSWEGEIDGPLKKFLLQAGAFYTWKEQHQPRRRVEFSMVLVELNVTGNPPPKVLQELNVKAWIEMHDYFVTVAHHGGNIDLAEFDGWVDALERTILNLLSPRTFADFDAIDAILGADRDA